MTLTTCIVTLVGTALAGAKDDRGNYYISVPSLEDYLGERRNSTREKVASKSLKAALGKGIPLGKKRVGESYVTFVEAKDFSKYVGWLAKNGHTTALNLCVALVEEAIERRIDSALKVETTEEEYERRTFEFFRELARKSFLPEFTSHLQAAEVVPAYGAEVNNLKRALALPLHSIDSYSHQQIEQWSKGITRYDTLRMQGFGHKRALTTIAHLTQARA
jgi:hypothetical protein